MKKRANMLIRKEIMNIVKTHNGIATVMVIDLVTYNLFSTSAVRPFLTRQRVSGNVSAIVCKYMLLNCINSCLYV